MNLEDMLNEALEKIENMTASEFENECIKAGYHPERKEAQILICDKCNIEMESYSHRVKDSWVCSWSCNSCGYSFDTDIIDDNYYANI